MNMKKEDQATVWALINSGTYFLAELQKNPSRAMQNKFQQVVDEHERPVFPADSPHGLAVCRECHEVCRLTSAKNGLQRHKCARSLPVKSLPYSSASDTNLSKKNLAEKERKEEVALLIKESACLVLGKETFKKIGSTLCERTKLRIVRSCLSEIPPTILQFFSDGKSPVDRSEEFFAQLFSEISELNSQVVKAQSIFHQRNNAVCTNGWTADPTLHLHLSYPAEKTDDPDITWMSNEVEKGPLELNRENLIGCTLRDIVHPEDYSHIKDQLVPDVLKSPKDFAFPLCHIAEPVKRNKAVQYRRVFLSGSIRYCPRLRRDKEPVSSRTTAENAIQLLSNPRMALFLKPKTHYRYMTLHSFDGRILQADERITFVTGYSVDEVIGELAYKFIHTEASAVYLQQARDNWLNNKDSGIVTYPLRSKIGCAIYLRSEAELVQYRDVNTLKSGFILINSVIDESDFVSSFKQPSRASIVEIQGDEVPVNNSNDLMNCDVSSVQYSPSMSNEELESLLGCPSPLSISYSSGYGDSSPEPQAECSSRVDFDVTTSTQLDEEITNWDQFDTSMVSHSSGNDSSLTEMHLSSDCLNTSFSSVFNNSHSHLYNNSSEQHSMNDTGFEESLIYFDL